MKSKISSGIIVLFAFVLGGLSMWYFSSKNKIVIKEEGEKVDFLIAPAFSESSVSKILTIKKTKKVKPIKMANFNTLIGHMIKTKERLKATLETTEDSNTINDLKEKIDWLEKGINLFRV